MAKITLEKEIKVEKLIFCVGWRSLEGWRLLW
jgi:hypothetical protein